MVQNKPMPLLIDQSNRKALIIQNQGPASVWLGFGEEPKIGQCLTLQAGERYESSFVVHTGEIVAALVAGTGASANVCIAEA
jgi:hypothetical protein